VSFGGRPRRAADDFFMAIIDKDIPILVVDDSMTARVLVCRLLKQLGFRNIEGFQNPVDALRRLGEKKFQLMVLDWHMEPMTGLELLKALRCDDRHKAIPAILMSADPTVTQVAEARDAGARGFLLKPFSVNALKARVEQAFQ
jgi:two-component system chemotaxis response regulator CheY